MEYDPLKNRLARAIDMFPALRKLVYMAFNLIFLRQRYVLKEIRNLFRETDKIDLYDAGAGFCQYSAYVLSHWLNSNAFATDLKTDYLRSFSAYADIYYPGRFTYKTADLQTFTPSQKFNLALAIDIMEHIEDDVSTLNNLYNALEKKGYLLLSTPSDLNETAKFTSEHIRAGYNKKELENKLNLIGFRIIKSIYTYGTYGALSWKLLIKIPLQLISKKLYPLLPLYYLLVYPLAEILMRLDMKTDNKQGTGILIVAQKP